MNATGRNKRLHSSTSICRLLLALFLISPAITDSVTAAPAAAKGGGGVGGVPAPPLGGINNRLRRTQDNERAATDTGHTANSSP